MIIRERERERDLKGKGREKAVGGKAVGNSPEKGRRGKKEKEKEKNLID